MICYTAENVEAGKQSLNLAVTAVVGQHSRVTVPVTPDVIDVATLPAQRFWQETVSLLDSM